MMPEVIPSQSKPPELAEMPDTNPWLAHAVRRGTGVLAMGTALFAGGFVGGDTLTSTHATLGPNEVAVNLTADAHTTIDLGPLGSITAPGPVKSGPLRFSGVNVRVEQIPDGDGKPLGPSDISRLTGFFTAEGLKSDEVGIEAALLKHGLESGGLTLGAGLLVGLLLGSRGRAAARESLHSRRVQAAGLAAVTMLTLAGSGISAAPAPKELPGDPVLASLGMPDVRVQGKILETLVDTYGPKALDYIKDVNAYYADIDKRVMAAYTAKLQEERDTPNAISLLIASGDADQVEWVSDNHCNRDMAALAAHLARTVQPAFIIDTGDQTMSGTAAEKGCVSVLPSEDGHIPIVVALGNHDDPRLTASQDKSLGYKVLDGRIVTIQGYTMLGDSDTMRTGFGGPTFQQGTETVSEEGDRIADLACSKDGGVDMVIMHNPGAGQTSAIRGCTRLVLDGHVHQLQGPFPYKTDGDKTSYMFINGTSGGAAPNKITFESKLGKEATIMMLVFDKKTKAPIGYRVIAVEPDKTVHIGDLEPMTTVVGSGPMSTKDGD